MYGNAAELSRGSQLSSVITIRSQPTKRPAITVVDNNTKAIAILRLTRDFLAVNLLILCGDIAQNPGPGDALRGKGLKVCRWNVQHLTNSKLEEIRVLLTSLTNKEEKPDLPILPETFCSVKVPDSFYSTSGYQMYRKDRTGKFGGGILAYVNDSLQVNRREDLEEIDLECLWLEICPYKSNIPYLLLASTVLLQIKRLTIKDLEKNLKHTFIKQRDHYFWRLKY